MRVCVLSQTCFSDVDSFVDDVVCDQIAGVIDLLESWDRDVAGSYRDSFMLRDSIKLVGETTSPLIAAQQEARVSSANSELERETAEAVSKRERDRHFKSDPHKYYEYCKVGLGECDECTGVRIFSVADKRFMQSYLTQIAGTDSNFVQIVQNSCAERMLRIERSRAKEAHRTGQERGWK